jgi:hypothetical protein
VTAVAADKWLRRFRGYLVVVLGIAVGAIGSLAFYTSFEAIKQYAKGSGGIDPRHDFAIPLLVDSFIVVATGADLWFATTGHRRGLWEMWWPKALLAGAAGVSFTLNVAHVKGDDWAARGVAAIPPAALILGVELLMMVLRRATALRTERLASPAAEAVESPPAEVEVSREDAPGLPEPAGPATSPGTALVVSPPRTAPASPRSRRPASRGTKRPAAGPSKAEQIRAMVTAERAAGRAPSPGDIARVLGADKAQVRRVIAAMPAPNGRALVSIEEGRS